MTRQDPIALVSTYYPPVRGGVETSAAGIARFLVERGHEVHVFTKRTTTEVPAEETMDGVAVHRLPPVGPRRGSGKWLVLRALTSALTRMKPARRAIHCVDYRGVGLAALAARRSLRVPVIFQAGTEGVLAANENVEATRGTAARVAHRLARSLLTAAYRRADLFICVSRGIERETLAAGVPRERVIYLPHPVRLADFAPVDPQTRTELRARLGLPTDGLVVVSVGRLSQEKGTTELAQAWKDLAFPHAHLVMVGGGDPGHPWDTTQIAQDMAARSEPSSRVIATGNVPPERVADYLRAADLAVQPPHFEAFGIAALEEMAAGIPVIASDVGGLRDFVETDVNGVRVPPYSPTALVAAMRRLLTDDRLRRHLGAGALATAALFDEATVLTRLAEIIETLARYQ